MAIVTGKINFRRLKTIGMASEKLFRNTLNPLNSHPSERGCTTATLLKGTDTIRQK